MNNIMLDIETIGTGTNAAIVSIGAVRFDDNGVSDKFDKVINLTSCLFAGFDIDQGTVKWWMEQSAQARKRLLRRSVNIARALIDFSDWIGSDAIVWGNRCYRSIKAMYKDIEYQHVGVKHCAVDDANSQSLHLIKCIGGSGTL